jgi:hypothetical protein
MTTKAELYKRLEGVPDDYAIIIGNPDDMSRAWDLHRGILIDERNLTVTLECGPRQLRRDFLSLLRDNASRHGAALDAFADELEEAWRQ